jgi:hypothetical protein
MRNRRFDAALHAMNRSPPRKRESTDNVKAGLSPPKDGVLSHAYVPAMTSENGLPLIRHARPRAGHPRLNSIAARKGVDGRDKPGHDK